MDRSDPRKRSLYGMGVEEKPLSRREADHPDVTLFVEFDPRQERHGPDNARVRYVRTQHDVVADLHQRGYIYMLPPLAHLQNQKLAPLKHTLMQGHIITCHAHTNAGPH